MKRKFEEIDFLQLLYKAIRNVDTTYQSIETKGLEGEDDKEIARERVYCYELYHQLRLIMGELFYDVNGEIDKRGHQRIREGFNPDIIIHKQRSMDHNELVLEAKVKWDKEGVKKDFCTLYKMTECYKYNLGVFLFVGNNLSEIKTKLLLIRDNISVNKKIHIICVNKNNIETCSLESILGGVL